MSSNSELPHDPGKELYTRFIRELLRRLATEEVASTLSAAELELIRKVAADNTINLASIRKGDFGAVAQAAAEEFPFPDGSEAAGVALQ